MRSALSLPSVRAGVVSRSGSGTVKLWAFTLVELLVVIAVIVVVLAMVVPAFTQVNTARQITLAAYNVSGVLENARAYARANGTYTWVGFFEEDPTKSAGQPGVGRVVISVVASKIGMAPYTGTDTNPPALDNANSPFNVANKFGIVQISKLVKLDNTSLTVLDPSDNSKEVPARAKVTDGNGQLQYVPTNYQVGDSSPVNASNFANRSAINNGTTFGYPLYSATPTYRFTKIIQFNPLGDATKIVDTPTPLLEIGLRPTRGNVVSMNSKNLAAIQVTGIGGAVRIFQQ